MTFEDFCRDLDNHSEETRLELLRNRLRGSFFDFCKFMKPSYDWFRLHQVITQLAEEAYSTDDGRLILAIPPGAGKSTICSKLLPAWAFCINPKERIMILSYGNELSESLGKDVRELMNDEMYKTLFPEAEIKGRGESGTFDLKAGGFLRCKGRREAITGFRSSLTICDDTLKDDNEAKSDKILDGLWDWFNKVAYSRLVNKGKLVAFNTRWCERDLPGRLTRAYPDWKYVNIESICEDEENDVLGRKVGEHIGDYYQPLKKLLEIKANASSTFYNLYQGKPINLEASPIKKQSFLLDLPNKVDPDKSVTVISWDTASSPEPLPEETTKDPDYSVATVWRLDSDHCHLMAIRRFRKDINGLLDEFDDLNKQWQPVTNIVENASSGIQLIQMRTDKCTKAKTFNTESKEETAKSFNTMLCIGMMTHMGGVITAEYIEELQSFTFGRHDDLLISILLFVRQWRDTLGTSKCLTKIKSQQRKRNMPKNLKKYLRRGKNTSDKIRDRYRKRK